MYSHRLLYIYFKNVSQLNPIHQWEYDHQARIHQYSLQLIFTHSDHFLMELYGFDGEKKWSSKRIQDLSRVFLIISMMPMGSLPPRSSFSKKNVLFNLCDLPTHDPNTSHCFADATHQTCCLLGGQARRYADASGNPIGKAAAQAFFQKYGFAPKEQTLTPWCTCMGSGVCTFYASKFTDGTHLKFLHRTSGGILMNEQNENKYAMIHHKTPGVS